MEKYNPEFEHLTYFGLVINVILKMLFLCRIDNFLLGLFSLYIMSMNMNYFFKTSIILLYKAVRFFCLKPKILIINNTYEFCILGKLYIAPRMVLDNLILYLSLGLDYYSTDARGASVSNLIIHWNVHGKEIITWHWTKILQLIIKGFRKLL